MEKEEIQVLINTAISNTQVEVNNFTYPVFIADDNHTPDLIASSVVIKVDNKNYLVTAAHVLQQVLNAKSQFLIGVDQKYVQLEGEFVFSSHDDKDHFDIAVIELTDEFVSEHGIKVLDESRLATNDKFEKVHIALLHGFPNSKNKQQKALRGTTSFKVKAVAYGGVIKKDFQDWSKFGKLPELHTCMTYTKTKDHNKPISPSGFSGGGLWILPSVYYLGDYYLDSIMIEYHKNAHVTFSTKIDSVVDFIKQYA
ncbi:hypothetical protein [Aliivibrio fischeri]|uniref:hypothetical protein n=1 Tax=Aliivibrio fischeri TaxID=668 RepID=UPI0012D8B735|nr:hypothetical protein [Aliivibrio fischeri]MUK28408.1 hypothetical protein [Aliivibrio fischeri]MUK33298.1 hypothetical protein [Aliivibrio fischeri]